MYCQEFENGEVCEYEVAMCGNGIVESRVTVEQCDDGNTVDGDGCSSVCMNECTYPEIYSNGQCINYFKVEVVSPVGHPSCKGAVFTSGYGIRVHPISGEVHIHDGVDIAKNHGCVVTSVNEGTLNYQYDYGNTIRIIHDQTYTTVYGHGRDFLSTEGIVRKNSEIMFMGQSGQATGTHLHFVLRKGGSDFINHTDPVPYFEQHFILLDGF